jgi:hypothetical protein
MQWQTRVDARRSAFPVSRPSGPGTTRSPCRPRVEARQAQFRQCGTHLPGSRRVPSDAHVTDQVQARLSRRPMDSGNPIDDHGPRSPVDGVGPGAAPDRRVSSEARLSGGRLRPRRGEVAGVRDLTAGTPRATSGSDGRRREAPASSSRRSPIRPGSSSSGCWDGARPTSAVRPPTAPRRSASARWPTGSRSPSPPSPSTCACSARRVWCGASDGARSSTTRSIPTVSSGSRARSARRSLRTPEPLPLLLENLRGQYISIL